MKVSIAHKMTANLGQQVYETAKGKNAIQYMVLSDGQIIEWEYDEHAYVNRKGVIGEVEVAELLPSLVLKYISNKEIMFGTPEEKEKVKKELLEALKSW